MFGFALLLHMKTQPYPHSLLYHLSLHQPSSEQESAQDLQLSYDSSDCPTCFPQQVEISQHTTILQQKTSSYPRDDVWIIAFSQFSSK